MLWTPCGVRLTKASPGKEPRVKNLGYLFAAYTIIWTVLFIYVATLSRKNRALAEDLRLLQTQVAKAITK